MYCYSALKCGVNFISLCLYSVLSFSLEHPQRYFSLMRDYCYNLSLHNSNFITCSQNGANSSKYWYNNQLSWSGVIKKSFHYAEIKKKKKIKKENLDTAGKHLTHQQQNAAAYSLITQPELLARGLCQQCGGLQPLNPLLPSGPSTDTVLPSSHNGMEVAPEIWICSRLKTEQNKNPVFNTVFASEIVPFRTVHFLRLSLLPRRKDNGLK